MAVTIQMYNQFPELIGDSSIDLDGHTFKMALMDSSFVFDAADAGWADVSADELPNGNGYTANGLTLASVTWTTTGNTAKFDFNDPVWTASGGSITARFAVIYRNATDGTIVNPIHSVCLLDTAPADVTATTGNTFTVTPNATGFFTITTNNAD